MKPSPLLSSRVSPPLPKWDWLVTDFAADHGAKFYGLLERVLGEIDDPQKSLREIIGGNEQADLHHIELQRMRGALTTYLNTDPNLRYVAFVGSFSSGKTATLSITCLN